MHLVTMFVLRLLTLKVYILDSKLCCNFGFEVVDFIGRFYNCRLIPEFYFVMILDGLLLSV